MLSLATQGRYFFLLMILMGRHFSCVLWMHAAWQMTGCLHGPLRPLFIFLFLSAFVGKPSRCVVCVRKAPSFGNITPGDLLPLGSFSFFLLKREIEEGNGRDIYSLKNNDFLSYFIDMPPLLPARAVGAAASLFLLLLIPHDLHARDVSIVLTISRKYHKSCEILVPRPPFFLVENLFMRNHYSNEMLPRRWWGTNVTIHHREIPFRQPYLLAKQEGLGKKQKRKEESKLMNDSLKRVS